MYDFDSMVCACDECPYCSDEWCDKVGGKLSLYGICDDAVTTIHVNHIHISRQNRGLEYRRRMRRKKNKRRRDIIKTCGYYPPAGWLDYEWVDGVYTEIGTHIKYPRDSNAQRFLKRESNKRVRRYKGDIHKGNSYRKLFDYWWELY